MAKPSKKGPETTVKIFCASCKQYLYKYRKVGWAALQGTAQDCAGTGLSNLLGDNQSFYFQSKERLALSFDDEP